MEVLTLKNKNKGIIMHGIFFLIVMIFVVLFGKESMNVNCVAGESFIFSLMLTSETETRDYKTILLLVLTVIVGIIVGAMILGSLSVHIATATIGGAIVCIVLKKFAEIITPKL